MPTSHRAPLVRSGLSFTLLVIYDDPAHRVYDERWYAPLLVNDPHNLDNYPIVRTGQATVTLEYVEVPAGQTNETTLNKLKRVGLERPDFAETRTFHLLNPDQRRIWPVVSLCGKLDEAGPMPHVYDVWANIDPLQLGVRLLNSHRQDLQWHLGVRLRVPVI